MAEPVVIADYDWRWPALYDQEKARIIEAISDHTVAFGALAQEVKRILDESAHCGALFMLPNP
jgi:hypothetical protein